jgi:hypothetical protein
MVAGGGRNRGTSGNRTGRPCHRFLVVGRPILRCRPRPSTDCCQRVSSERAVLLRPLTKNVAENGTPVRSQESGSRDPVGSGPMSDDEQGRLEDVAGRGHRRRLHAGEGEVLEMLAQQVIGNDPGDWYPCPRGTGRSRSGHWRRRRLHARPGGGRRWICLPFCISSHALRRPGDRPRWRRSGDRQQHGGPELMPPGRGVIQGKRASRERTR